MLKLRKSAERGYADHGWLKSYHSFSFADYYDPDHMGWGNLRVINEDRIEPGTGFGKHSHRNMEIISYVLSGELAHQDSLGNIKAIPPGDVQRMSAGRGVQHSEFNPSEKEAVHLLQIWIKPDRMAARPRYEEKSLVKAKTGVWHLVASKTGRDKSIAINQEADLLLAKLNPKDTVEHALQPGRHAWVHVAEGEVTLNGKKLNAGDAAAVSDEGDLKFTATKNSQVLLFDLN